MTNTDMHKQTGEGETFHAQQSEVKEETKDKLRFDPTISFDEIGEALAGSVATYEALEKIGEQRLPLDLIQHKFDYYRHILLHTIGELKFAQERTQAEEESGNQEYLEDI